ncbi:MAG: HNH endonuclease [Candidatus Wallbacteria bacterium]|nr:HNH endonuclease [Candidatus Wallbacteria bacterium]
MTLATLTRKIKDLQADLATAEADLACEPQRFKVSLREYDSLHAEAAEKLNLVEHELKHVRRLLAASIANDQRTALESRLGRLTSKHAELSGALVTPASRKNSILERIEVTRARIEVLGRFLPAAEKRQRIVALAAAHSGSARAIAGSIRAQLDISPFCPYCGEPLLGKGHADHIYPVAHGGLSTPRNMVYICATCNQRKADMTLRQFVRKFSLDSDRIELELTRLGKRF